MRRKKSVTVLCVVAAGLLVIAVILYVGFNRGGSVTDADFADVEFQLVDSVAGDTQEDERNPTLGAGDRLSWSDQKAQYNAQIYWQHQGEGYKIKKGTQFKIGISTEETSHYEIGFCSATRKPLAAFFRGAVAENEISLTAERDLNGYFYVWNMSASELPIREFTVTIVE